VEGPGDLEGAFAAMVRGRVDAVFQGARPGDLLVEQPTKVELVIDLRTARALGPTIHPSVLARADQVVE
jgi:putative ABC transport system substrate-binding protein